MRAEIAALPTMMRVSAADHFAYRAEMVIWILTSILPLFMLALWNAVVADGAIAGFGQAEMARYFAATLVCRQLTGSWVVWELSFAIRTGRLSTWLLRPISPLWVYAVWMVTAMPYRIVILSPVVAALAWSRPDLLAWPGWAAFGLFCVSISLAWLMNFLIQCLIATVAFWLDKTDGLFGLWFAAWSVASGYLAPLALFPESVRTVLDLLPFRFMLALPVELLGGFVTPDEALGPIGLQLGWTAVMIVALTAAWRRGLRRYGAFGA